MLNSLYVWGGGGGVGEGREGECCNKDGSYNFNSPSVNYVCFKISLMLYQDIFVDALLTGGSLWSQKACGSVELLGLPHVGELGFESPPLVFGKPENIKKE